VDKRSEGNYTNVWW